MKPLILAALLLGCASAPSALRAPTPTEHRAIGAARQAWDAAGRPRVECDALSRARVAVIQHAQLQGECGVYPGWPEVNGCIGGVNLCLWEPPRYMIFVDADLDADLQGSVVVHEALHGLRSCAVDEVSGQTDEYLRRYKEGETPECRIPYAADHFHCDSELWGAIHADGLARWRRP